MTRRHSALLVLAAAAVAHGAAHAYSTKLHMVTGEHIRQLLKKNGCHVKLDDWNQKFKSNDAYLKNTKGKSALDVDLGGEVCDLITNPATSQYFLAGTTGPDTFPGMFGNTDPTHALMWNTAWQIPVLWQNASTKQEKAFVLGWLVHFAGDLNAHGLANLHATGIWMQESNPDTVWKHIYTEAYYAKFITPYPRLPDGSKFDNTLVWPEAFVKKMFFNPQSILYRHYDFLFNRYLDSGDLGGVAKGFGSVWRALYLLWDFHGRQLHKWKGHADFYQPQKGDSISSYLHWLFADQAYNFHKKKLAAMKKVIDTWYEGTHRAQQAIVADGEGKFDGSVLYDKKDEVSGTVKVTPKAFQSKGVKGVLDAYRLVGDAFAEYLAPDVFTITKDNFPELRSLLDELEKAGEHMIGMLNTVRAIVDKLKEVVTAPVRAIKEAATELLKDDIRKMTDYLIGDLACEKLDMCGTVKALRGQAEAFGVKAGDIGSYLNWPVYRNTITTAALALQMVKSGKMPRESGDETKSPLFGLPSGDFGCTGSCTGLWSESSRLFMPMAGSYYQDAKISGVMPDYCMANMSDKRRAEALNGKYKGLTNDQSNDASPSKGIGDDSYTCFVKAKEGNKCASDAYGMRTNEEYKGKVGKYLNSLFKLISGRFSVKEHPVKKRGPMVGTNTNVGPCYGALSYGEGTKSSDIPNPETDKVNTALYKKEAYSLRDLVGSLWDGVKDLLGQAWSAFKGYVKAKVKEVVDFLAGKAKEAYAAATKWIADKVAGARAYLGQVWETVKDIASHGAHWDCLGEVTAHAKAVAKELIARQKKQYDGFWATVAPFLKALPGSKERVAAVTGPWGKLNDELIKEVNRIDDQGKARVKNWATFSSTQAQYTSSFSMNLWVELGTLATELRKEFTTKTN